MRNNGIISNRTRAGQTTTTSDNIILDNWTIHSVAWPFLLFSAPFCTEELYLYPYRCYSAKSPPSDGKIQTQDRPKSRRANNVALSHPLATPTLLSNATLPHSHVVITTTNRKIQGGHSVSAEMREVI